MLIDIDKSLDGKGPLPSAHDVLNEYMSKGTNSTNYVTPSTDLSMIAGGFSGQLNIIKTGDFTAPFFDSVSSAPGTFAQARKTLATLPHGLSFKPAIVAFMGGTSTNADGSTYTYFQTMPYLALDFHPTYQYGIWTNFSVGVDATNVYIYADTLTGGINSTLKGGSGYGTFQFVYYLLQQTSN